MSRPTRTEALRLLQLQATADGDAIKRAYRRLAREHHPDRGGDTATFHRLQQAYERLVDDGDDIPAIVPGRPSRPHAGYRDPTRADLGSIDWRAEPGTGERRLDRNEVAVWLVGDHTGPVRPLHATSRAPGSRANGLARMLASDLTAHLRIAGGLDDRGREVVVVEVRGSTRKARKALDGARLAGVWQRTRTSSSTGLRSELEPSEDRRATAVRSVERLEALLDALAWPLEAWTRTAGGA
ncbi:J domain-containing protein [Egicoccus sp. AB-alg6-2]|uniref:J domain-containing protein n=1 Tax=Egicoccus sp. AB-alg6-2 TaxID=3242692 RepID=UPI00359D42F3